MKQFCSNLNDYYKRWKSLSDSYMAHMGIDMLYNIVISC